MSEKRGKSLSFLSSVYVGIINAFRIVNVYGFELVRKEYKKDKKSNWVGLTKNKSQFQQTDGLI